MKIFLTELLSVAVLFLICFATAFFIEVLKNYMKADKAIKPKETSPKIYYVKNVVTKKKKRKSPSKKTDIALKGIVLNPNEIKRTNL